MLVHYTDQQIAMIGLGPLQWVTNGYIVMAVDGSFQRTTCST